MKKYFIWAFFAFFLLTNSVLGAIKEAYYNIPQTDRAEITDWKIEDWKYKSKSLDFETQFCKNYNEEKVPKFFYVKKDLNQYKHSTDKCEQYTNPNLYNDINLYYNCINKAIVQTQIEDFCENYSKFQEEKTKVKVDNPEIKDKCSLSKEELRIKYASYIEDRKVSKSYWEEKQFLLTVQNAKSIDVQEFTGEKYNLGNLKDSYIKNQRALIAEKELQNIENECKKTEETKKEEPKQEVKKEEPKKEEPKTEKPKEEPKKVVQKEVKKELIDQLMSKYSKQSLQKLIVPLETLRKDPKFEDRTDIIDYMLQKIRSL